MTDENPESDPLAITVSNQNVFHLLSELVCTAYFLQNDGDFMRFIL